MKQCEGLFLHGIHLIIQVLVLLLLAIAGYTVFEIAAFAWHSLLIQASSDALIEGIVVRALGTVIIIETIFVVRKLDERHHLNVGLALDVAATFLIRETVLALYTHAHPSTVALLLASVAVMVILRISHSHKKHKEISNA